MEGKILEVLLDWNYWGGFRKELIPREGYEARLGFFMEGKEIIAVKGIRRAGKTSLILSYLSSLIGEGRLLPEETLIINLEDPRLPYEVDGRALMKIFEVYARNKNPEGKGIVVLDEVQHARGWEKFARWLSETKGFKVIVTGSSSKLMSEEYASALTGRHLDLKVSPLTFEEFLKFRGVGFSDSTDLLKQRFKIQKMLIEYLTFGGFPEVVLSGSEERRLELLRNYFNDILTKDVARRFNVTKLTKLEQLARNYLSNISSIQSFNRLKRELGISLDTVEKYSEYLKTAGLLTFVDKFSSSVTEQARSMKKVYAADNGFYTASGFRFMENAWRMMENAVAAHLAFKVSVDPLTEVYYFKAGDYEVDFVVKIGKAVGQLIQVTYASGRDEVRKREIRALVKAANGLSCKDLQVITWDYEGEEVIEEGIAIRFVPLWKWLLEKGQGAKG